MARRPLAVAVMLTASLAILLLGVAAPAAGTTPPVTSVPDTSAPDTSAPDTSVPAGTDPATTESTTTSPATLAPAVRGTAIQESPTLPDPNPTTTAPPPTTRPPSTTAPAPPAGSFAAPPNSGTGRRVVYSKSRMRVWIIESSGAVARTYRVSGRLSMPSPGTYKVFSRSSYTCNIKATNVCMRWMVRFTKGPSGDNIGFHEIPRRDGVPVQSDSQLGQALSGGCVRQATGDALTMWNWAGIGTKVVVLG
jgi:lipoprotein-anchoring transpeptidase ErfK/SrfK